MIGCLLSNRERLCQYLVGTDDFSIINSIGQRHAELTPIWEFKSPERGSLKQVRLTIGGVPFEAAVAGSKQDAKKAAAIKGVSYLHDNKNPFVIDRIQNRQYVSILNNFCQALLVKQPVFNIVNIGIPPLNQFKSTVDALDRSFTSDAIGLSKSEAKQKSARLALESVLEKDEFVDWAIKAISPVIDVSQASDEPSRSYWSQLFSAEPLNDSPSTKIQPVATPIHYSANPSNYKKLRDLAIKHDLGNPFMNNRVDIDGNGVVTTHVQMMLNGKCFTSDKFIKHSDAVDAVSKKAICWVEEKYGVYANMDVKSVTESFEYEDDSPVDHENIEASDGLLPFTDEQVLPVANIEPTEQIDLEPGEVVDLEQIDSGKTATNTTEPSTASETSEEACPSKKRRCNSESSDKYNSDAEDEAPSYCFLVEEIVRNNDMSLPDYQLMTDPKGFKCNATLVLPSSETISSKSLRPHSRKANAKEDAAHDIYALLKQMNY